MPHLVLEASAKMTKVIEKVDLVQKLHDELGSSEVVEKARIKTRAFFTETAIVGEKGLNDFLHVTISILSGHSQEVRRELGNKMFDRLSMELKGKVELGTAVTLEVREMESETYFR